MRRIDPRNFQRATRSTPRAINRQIALTLIREHQPISRADLARRMSVTRGAITEITGELIAKGIIIEAETATGGTGRGRRPTMLRVRTRDRLVVAIDVRFSRTYVMLADFGGNQLALESFETVADPPALVEALASRIHSLLLAHGGTGRCEGIGLAVPGMVDHVTGVVLNAPQLGWKDVPVRDALSAATALPVMIENASLACALAKIWLGSEPADTAGDFVYVTVGDGVGAGIVANGQVLRGRTFSAGEFGHLPLDVNGPLCLCGRRGCWEVYASNLATVSRYLGRPFSGAEGERLHGLGLAIEDLIERAQLGDEGAIDALETTGHHLGVGLAGIVNALNPGHIFVGGEITAAWDLVAPPMRRAIESRALTSAAGATPVIPEQIGGYPRLWGATSLVTAPMFAAPVVG